MLVYKDAIDFLYTSWAQKLCYIFFLFYWFVCISEVCKLFLEKANSEYFFNQNYLTL